MKYSLNKGTTIIEALVAVLILTIGILPSLATILMARNFESLIRNNLIAANLAQEGVEVVRAIRDANWFADPVPRPFDSGLSDGNYRVEWNSTALLSESGNPAIKVSPAGLYNYTTGTDTTFRRRVIITKIDPAGCNCDLRIISEVTWLEKGRAETIRIESHLFNWQ